VFRTRAAAHGRAGNELANLFVISMAVAGTDPLTGTTDAGIWAAGALIPTVRARPGRRRPCKKSGVLARGSCQLMPLSSGAFPYSLSERAHKLNQLAFRAPS
jgi:hypothetical protein